MEVKGLLSIGAYNVEMFSVLIKAEILNGR